MTNLAEKFEFATDPSVHVVRAFCLPDLNDKGQWMVNCLRDRLPGQQDPQIFNWLRSVIDAQDYHFVRTEHAVALSELKRERMMSMPQVIDHFVLIEEGEDISEGEALYDDMKRWAFSLGVAEIVINSAKDSHVGRDIIEGRLGKLHKREVLFLKVGK